ncbi:MAG: glycosyltransferase [Endomicrobiales bacterium]|nr:glycosyltransferase [Endomicrobiales bacterium]
MKIDILLVTHRLNHLKECLPYLLKHKNNILIVVDGFNAELVNYIENQKKNNEFIKYIVIDEKVEKSKARNTGIKDSKADIIYFMDDDAYFTGNNLDLIKEKFKQYTDVSIIGGPNLTPPDSSFFQRVSGYVFSSVFTAWKMRKRYFKGLNDKYCDDKELILCNLAVKKDVLVKENIFFDERLTYNEENLLLHQLKNRGYKMLYCPDISVYHLRRNSILQFSKQIYKSGEGRAMMTYLLPGSLSLFHILPLLFVLYLIAVPLINTSWIKTPLLVYLVTNLLNSLYLTAVKKENIFTSVILFALSFIAHISYGIGFIRGLLWKLKI